VLHASVCRCWVSAFILAVSVNVTISFGLYIDVDVYCRSRDAGRVKNLGVGAPKL